MENIQNEEMITKKKSINTNSMYYGLIIGSIMIVYTLILYVSELLQNKYLGLLSFIVPVLGMVLGTLAFRDKYNDRFITYGKSFKSIFLIGLYFTIIYVIWSFVLYDFIATDALNKMIEIKKDEILSNPRMSDSQKSAQLVYMTKNLFLISMVVMELIMFSAFSAIVGLIAAAFIKKEEPQLL